MASDEYCSRLEHSLASKELLIEELKVKLAELEYELDRIKAFNADKAHIIEQLRLELQPRRTAT
jgi:uncharacterized coiled-coil protein SlyX